ncbi:hypothetical protein ILYODFUR_035136 [Ilyodon furcidens]|uniref:Secreted protein n=1 Tax=Ilyodon furcidens TaxID=33524 RepID=A0ABV0ULM3_9TELE
MQHFVLTICLLLLHNQPACREAHTHICVQNSLFGLSLCCALAMGSTWTELYTSKETGGGSGSLGALHRPTFSAAQEGGVTAAIPMMSWSH